MVYSGLTLVSRFMGFLRDLAVSYRMGASETPAADAYNTALAFPNLFRRIFAEGAFAAAFVPAYSRALETEGEEAADRLASDAMATLAAATVLITIIAQLAMPWLMYVMNPGYADDPVKFKLSVILTQISMPYLPCMAIVAQLSGVLNARGRFAISAGAPVLLNLAMLAAILPQKDAIGAAYAASWGIVAAGLLQVGLVWWGVRKTGARIIVRPPRLTPEIKALIGLAIPGAIAASATQVNIFISGILASSVDGARSWLAAADRLYQLPLGLVGVAVGVALLPQLSRAVHAGDPDRAQSAMDEAITFSMALTLPAAAALIAIPWFLIDALFTRGLFTAYDSQQTAAALLHYGWGVPAFVLMRVVTPAFFARQDTKAPMRFALISVVINIVLGVALFRTIGFQGIAMATSIAAWINVLQMLWTLRQRGTYRPSAKTWSRLARIGLSNLVFGALLFACAYFRPQIEGVFSGFRLAHVAGPKELAILVTCVVAALSYPPLLFAFGGVKLSELKAALRRKPASIEEEIGKTPAGPGLS
jgi:putative peptidoglycan lipid II flippase